ncbi:MAG: hypothetical protein H0V70_26190 [Ktedonobacteraceae bacterium]|nr:hypothetical protein [Ktedonobacteraceae bacterium]
MLRQCAWCLRLIDQAGECVSNQPLPKLYEASHGMCGVCGALWMEQVLTQGSSFYLEEDKQGTETLSQHLSPTAHALDFSIPYQERNIVPIVCEGKSDYSAHTRYPVSDNPQSGATDDILDLDLNKINQ